MSVIKTVKECLHKNKNGKRLHNGEKIGRESTFGMYRIIWDCVGVTEYIFPNEPEVQKF